MSIVLEMISDIILLTSIVVIVYFRDSMDPGLVGNCLLYVLLLPDNIYAEFLLQPQSKTQWYQ
jgi:hypothetical protein